VKISDGLFTKFSAVPFNRVPIAVTTDKFDRGESLDVSGKVQ